MRLDLEETRSGGLRGRRLSVVGLESDPPHRHWAEIRSQLQNTPLEPRLQQTVMAVFTALAEAEATVHGQTPESVHFHDRLQLRHCVGKTSKPQRMRMMMMMGMMMIQRFFRFDDSMIQ